MAKSAEEIVKRWQAGRSKAAANYAAGIDAVEGNPLEKAAAAGDKYLMNVQAAEARGTRAQKLRAFGVENWKQAAKAKADRVASGMAAAEAKYRQKMQTWAGIYAQQKAAAAAMPNNSIEDGLARVRRVIEIAKQAAGKM